ncbi:MAG: cytosolic phospholipase [Candidatus Dependentiae bacterium]|nr:cytosolic phospholipase [Candidatus Dependentiae bacterium]
MYNRPSIHVTSLLLTLCALVHCDAASKNVMVQNNSPHEMFGAIYQTNKSYGLRMGDATLLKPNAETTLKMPNANFFKQRMLYIDSRKENLPQKIDFENPTVFFAATPANLNFGRPTKLIYLESARGPEIIPADSKAEEEIREELRKSIAEESEHYGTVATVTSTKETLCSNEATYLNERRKITRATINTLLKKEINVAYMPNITLCISGGGFRAMLASLGALRGLEEIGVWGTIDYVASLSGGSWALIPWIQSKKSLTDYSDFVADHIAQQTEEKLIKNSLYDFNTLRHVKGLFGNSAGLTDLYSLVLSKRLLQPLKEKHLSIHFSELAKKVHPSQHPYPLCSAAMPYQKKLKSKYDWVTMSPWNIELAETGLSIPTWAFMRHFMNGNSIDATPEPWLGYLMGIWGSAFSMSMQEILLHTHNNNPEFATIVPRSWIKSQLVRKWLGAKHCTALVPNFVYGMPGIPHNYKSSMPLVDAGHCCNLPVPPFLHPQRNPELIIMLHSSINDVDAEKTLRKTFKLLRKKYPALAIDAKDAFSKPVVYWPSFDAKTPSVIHIGLYKNENFSTTYDPRKTAETKTFNFWYTTTQAQQLMGLMKQTIVDHKELFVMAIENAVEKKQKETSTLEWLSSNAKALFS